MQTKLLQDFATIATWIAMMLLELSKRIIRITIHFNGAEVLKESKLQDIFTTSHSYTVQQGLAGTLQSPLPPHPLPPHKWQKGTSQHNCLLMSHIHTPHTTYAECGGVRQSSSAYRLRKRCTTNFAFSPPRPSPGLCPSSVRKNTR